MSSAGVNLPLKVWPAAYRCRLMVINPACAGQGSGDSHRRGILGGEASTSSDAATGHEPDGVGQAKIRGSQHHRLTSAGLDPAGNGCIDFRAVLRDYRSHVCRLIQFAVSRAQCRMRDEGGDRFRTDVCVEPQHGCAGGFVMTRRHGFNPRQVDERTPHRNCWTASNWFFRTLPERQGNAQRE